jgi:hypothetical protein
VVGGWGHRLKRSSGGGGHRLTVQEGGRSSRGRWDDISGAGECPVKSDIGEALAAEEEDGRELTERASEVGFLRGWGAGSTMRLGCSRTGDEVGRRCGSRAAVERSRSRGGARAAAREEKDCLVLPYWWCR